MGAESLTTWTASTPTERKQGLRGVESLPDHIDGMLFVYEAPVSASYGMLDTVIPLDIWWFDGDGILIGNAEMDPCPAAPCASYGAPGPVRWVLETEAGRFDFALGSGLSSGETS